MAKFDSGFSASNFTLASYQSTLVPKYDSRIHTAAVDGYTLAGFQWDNVYPSLSPDKQDLLLTGRNFQMRADKVDFYNQVVTANPSRQGTRERSNRNLFEMGPQTKGHRHLHRRPERFRKDRSLSLVLDRG